MLTQKMYSYIIGACAHNKDDNKQSVAVYWYTNPHTAVNGGHGSSLEYQRG